MTEPTKVCPNCPENGRQPWSAFNVRERWEDGTTRNVSGWCRACTKVATKRWRDRNPEMARRQADPEYAARRRMQQRDYRRRVRGITPDRYRTLRVMGPPTSAAKLPLAPFADWLRTVGDNPEQIALAVHMPSRRVWGLLHGEWERVEVDTVDRALLAVGDGTTIDSLYPNVSLAA